MLQLVNITDHFTWSEANVTDHHELDNTIPNEVIPAIVNTSRGMERVRALLNNHSVNVSSWYRSPELNRVVRGSSTSQHMRGEAVDFTCPAYGTSLQIVHHLAKYPDLLKFDQLILEHTWVHISFPSLPNVSPKRQVLTLLEWGRYAQGITDKKGNPA